MKAHTLISLSALSEMLSASWWCDSWWSGSASLWEPGRSIQRLPCPKQWKSSLHWNKGNAYREWMLLKLDKLYWRTSWIELLHHFPAIRKVLACVNPFFAMVVLLFFVTFWYTISLISWIWWKEPVRALHSLVIKDFWQLHASTYRRIEKHLLASPGNTPSRVTSLCAWWCCT